MKNILVVIGVILLSAGTAFTQQVTLDEVTYAVGVQPDQIMLLDVPPRASLTTNVICAPNISKAVGFKGVKKGDQVLLYNLGDNYWIVEHMPTGGKVKIRVRRNVRPAVKPLILVKVIDRQVP